MFIDHVQLSDRTKVLYEVVIEENGGVLTVPAGLLWINSVPYEMPLFIEPVGTAPFRLWIERAAAGPDYYFDATMEGRPVSFNSDPTFIEAHLVAWRRPSQTAIHRLIHQHA